MSERLEQLFQAFGYRWVNVIRNPLSAIVSNAAKATRPPEIALNDPEWQNAVFGSMVDYYSFAELISGVAHEVRYENLLADPLSTIENCALFMDMSLDRKQCADIWDQVGLKSLTPDGRDHLFNAEVDKSKHVSREVLAKMEKLGISDLARRMNYSWPHPNELAKNNSIALGSPTTLVNALYGRLVPQAGRQYWKKQVGIGSLHCASNDFDALREAVDLLSKDRFRKFYTLLGPLTQDVPLHWSQA